MQDSWWEYTLREYLLDVNRRFTKLLSEELGKFSAALNDFLYDLFQNPSPDWHSRLDAFRAEQKQPASTSRPKVGNNSLRLLTIGIATYLSQKQIC